MEVLNDQECKICHKKCKSRKETHYHVKKDHGLTLGQYYTQYYPRYNLLDGSPIGYRGNVERYFSEDFHDEMQMYSWVDAAPKGQVKEWMLNRLKERIDSKSLSYAPSSVELDTISMMPKVFQYEKVFGSYEAACDAVGYEPLLRTLKEISPVRVENPTICIDTREQAPLNFKSQRTVALAYADYTLHGDDYTYTYVDRKSDSDFMGTFGKGCARFERELELAINMDSFIYVVIESTIGGVRRHAKNLAKNIQIEFPFKNMRRVLHKYPRRVQFVFTGSRNASQRLIPFLLAHGEDLWDYDVYFALRKRGLI